MYLFNIIVIIIIYIVFIIGILLLPAFLKVGFIKYMNKSVLYWFGFSNINVNKGGLKRYNDLHSSHRPFLVVCNHRSIFDHIILMSVLDNIAFLADINGLVVPGLQVIVRQMNGILLDPSKKGGKTAEKIMRYVSDRKANDSTLVIYPDRMMDLPAGENVAPFRSGAFVGRFDILPIVIKYKNFDIDPYCHFAKGETILYSILKRCLGRRCDVDIKILPLQSAAPGESIEGYKDRIHGLMSREYGRL